MVLKPNLLAITLNGNTLNSLKDKDFVILD